MRKFAKKETYDSIQRLQLQQLLKLNAHASQLRLRFRGTALFGTVIIEYG